MTETKIEYAAAGTTDLDKWVEVKGPGGHESAKAWLARREDLQNQVLRHRRDYSLALMHRWLRAEYDFPYSYVALRSAVLAAEEAENA